MQINIVTHFQMEVKVSALAGPEGQSQFTGMPCDWDSSTTGKKNPVFFLPFEYCIIDKVCLKFWCAYNYYF